MTSSVAEKNINRVSFQGWLPAQEAAEYLGVSREYVYRLKSMYDKGGAGIPGFMLGDVSHVLMFRVSDLDVYKRTHPDLGRNRTPASIQGATSEDAASAA